jgi:hypothetical protein
MPRIHWVARGTGIPKDRDEAGGFVFFELKKKNSKKLLIIERTFFFLVLLRFSVESCVEEI